MSSNEGKTGCCATPEESADAVLLLQPPVLPLPHVFIEHVLWAKHSLDFRSTIVDRQARSQLSSSLHAL